MGFDFDAMAPAYGVPCGGGALCRRAIIGDPMNPARTVSAAGPAGRFRSAPGVLTPWTEPERRPGRGTRRPMQNVGAHAGEGASVTVTRIGGSIPLEPEH